jgi:hypothetical protein
VVIWTVCAAAGFTQPASSHKAIKKSVKVVKDRRR